MKQLPQDKPYLRILELGPDSVDVASAFFLHADRSMGYSADLLYHRHTLFPRLLIGWPGLPEAAVVRSLPGTKQETVAVVAIQRDSRDRF